MNIIINYLNFSLAVCSLCLHCNYIAVRSVHNESSVHKNRLFLQSVLLPCFYAEFVPSKCTAKYVFNGYLILVMKLAYIKIIYFHLDGQNIELTFIDFLS